MAPSDIRPDAGSATAVREAVPDLIARLERRYHFRRPDEVRAFLLDHPDLLDLLVEGASKIRLFLPSDEPIAIEVLFDPEEQDDQGELFAVVSTRSEPEAVRPRLERLDREWLIDAGRPFAGQFNVAVEYR